MIIVLLYPHHRSPPKVTVEGWLSDLEKTVLAEKAKAKLLSTHSIPCSSCVIYFVETPILKKAVYTRNSQTWKMKFTKSWTITGEKCKISIAWPHLLTFCSSLPCRQGHPCAAQVFILVMIISSCCDRRSKAQGWGFVIISGTGWRF